MKLKFNDLDGWIEVYNKKGDLLGSIIVDDDWNKLVWEQEEDIKMSIGCLKQVIERMEVEVKMENEWNEDWREVPEEVLETSDDDTWKPCIRCGGELTQVRKALFTCLKCNQEYIADEEDMRDTKPFRIIKK